MMPSPKLAKLQDEAPALHKQIVDLRALEPKDDADAVSIQERLKAAETRAAEVAVEAARERELDNRLEELRKVTAATPASAPAGEVEKATRKAPAIHVAKRGPVKAEDLIAGGSFLRAIGMGAKAIDLRNMGETSPTYDGAGVELVSPELYRGFLETLAYQSVGVQLATLFETTSNEFQIPKIGDIEADWVEELTEVDDEALPTSREDIKLHEVGRLVTISRRLLDDAAGVANLATVFNRQISIAVATKIDNVWLNGDAGKEIDGLVDLVDAENEVEAGTDFDGGDLAEIVGKIDTRASNTAWIVSGEGWTHMLKSSVISQSTTVGDRVLPTVMGAPVYRVLGLPAGTLALYGDFAMATAVVLKQNGLEVAASEHAAFKSNGIVYRGLQRFGLANHDPQFVAKLVSAGS
jgi:HK97 family phage major capsid protein